jgi:hypoxanthine phosphoribosyltransferase
MTVARTAMPFPEVAARMKRALRDGQGGALGRVDAVVALARGGVVAGALAAYELGVPLRLMTIRFRHDNNQPRGDTPEVATSVPDVRGLRVLIVDDVSVSGATLRAAREALGTEAVTLVVKGKPGAADMVLFDDVPECARWPWFEDVDA